MAPSIHEGIDLLNRSRLYYYTASLLTTPEFLTWSNPIQRHLLNSCIALEYSQIHGMLDTGTYYQGGRWYRMMYPKLYTVERTMTPDFDWRINPQHQHYNGSMARNDWMGFPGEQHLTQLQHHIYGLLGSLMPFRT